MKNHIKRLLREGLATKFEYQVRNIGGGDVFYKRKIGSDIWSFINKDEFDKDSNKDNIIKYKS